MKKVTLILLSLTITLTAGWEKTYGGDKIDRGYCIQRISEDEYIVAGMKDYYKGNIWLLKINSEGDTIWTREYGEEEYDDAAYFVSQTSDHGFVLTGLNRSYGAGDADIWLFKTDSIGDTIWTRSYGYESDEVSYCVRQTADGGYIIIGRKVLRHSQLWILKTDSLGDTSWTHEFNHDGIGLDIVEGYDNGYLVAGMVRDWPLYTGEFDLWIFKTDSTTDTLWNIIYNGGGSENGPFDDIAYSIEKTSDSSFIISGTTTDLYGSYYALTMIKIDCSGNLLWDRHIRGDVIWYPMESHFSRAIEADDGGYVVTGGGLTLVKTDEFGQILWIREYGGFSSSVEKTSDGGYIVVGEKNADLWILKTDSLGNLAVEETIKPETQPGFEVVTAVGKQIVLRFANADRSQGDCVAIFDATGRLVDEIRVPAQGGTITWGVTPGDGFSPGVYFIREMGKSASTHKVVLVR